jgi:hypothetical protein
MLKTTTTMKTVLIVLGLVSLLAVSSANAKEWYFGLGTGFTFMNAEGDVGLTTNNFGSIQTPIDLDPSDFQDLMETGFGLGGYATDGTWMIGGQFGFVKLGGEPSGSLPADVGGGTFTLDAFFEITSGEFTIGYTAYRSANMKFSFTPYAGARYMKHKLGNDLSITQGATTTDLSLNPDNSWTDVLVGTSVGYVLSPKWTWSAKADAGFGGSEGTYSFMTALSWKGLKHFSFSPNFRYSAIEFENGVKGDADWYLYAPNEFGAGIAVMYHF